MMMVRLCCSLCMCGWGCVRAGCLFAGGCLCTGALGSRTGSVVRGCWTGLRGSGRMGAAGGGILGILWSMLESRILCRRMLE